ncbi:MAG: hypothetical protein JNN28_09280, partial [Saprospiraceae bacterium]|nr:hypothetical protein [Saprospiraceae bacterium]
HIPNLKEKTLRYPGHIALITALKDSGFFSEEPVKINGVDVSPLEFSSTILFKEWKLGPTEEELTVMKVIVEGIQDGTHKRVEYDLMDRYDENKEMSSMSRTTGFTCTAAANLIARRMFTDKGVFPPEYVGRDKICFDFILNYLKQRGVEWRVSE